MNLVVREGDVVLVFRVPAQSSAGSIAHRTHDGEQQRRADAPFLEPDLGVIGTGLGSNESLEVPDGVVRTALDAHCGRRSLFARIHPIHSFMRTFAPETVVGNDLHPPSLKPDIRRGPRRREGSGAVNKCTKNASHQYVCLLRSEAWSCRHERERAE